MVLDIPQLRDFYYIGNCFLCVSPLNHSENQKSAIDVVQTGSRDHIFVITMGIPHGFLPIQILNLLILIISNDNA